MNFLLRSFCSWTADVFFHLGPAKKIHSPLKNTDRKLLQLLYLLSHICNDTKLLLRYHLCTGVPWSMHIARCATPGVSQCLKVVTSRSTSVARASKSLHYGTITGNWNQNFGKPQHYPPLCLNAKIIYNNIQCNAKEYRTTRYNAT